MVSAWAPLVRAPAAAGVRWGAATPCLQSAASMLAPSDAASVLGAKVETLPGQVKALVPLQRPARAVRGRERGLGCDEARAQRDGRAEAPGAGAVAGCVNAASACRNSVSGCHTRTLLCAPALLLGPAYLSTLSENPSASRGGR